MSADLSREKCDEILADYEALMEQLTVLAEDMADVRQSDPDFALSHQYQAMRSEHKRYHQRAMDLYDLAANGNCSDM